MTPDSTTLLSLVTDLEAAIAALQVHDSVWSECRSFVVLGLIDGGPGVLPDVVENMGVVVSLPETAASPQGSVDQTRVDDQVLVTLFYRLGDGPDKRPSRDQALAREDELRVAVTAEGRDAVHVRRVYVGARRTLSTDRQWLIVQQRFRFNRFTAIGGS